MSKSLKSNSESTRPDSLWWQPCKLECSVATDATFSLAERKSLRIIGANLLSWSNSLQCWASLSGWPPEWPHSEVSLRKLQKFSPCLALAKFGHILKLVRRLTKWHTISLLGQCRLSTISTLSIESTSVWTARCEPDRLLEPSWTNYWLLDPSLRL